MSQGNQKCKNCGHEAGHHSSSSGMCPTPDGSTYYEPKEEVVFTPKPHFVFTGWRSPNDKKIVVPEGMLKAANTAWDHFGGIGIEPCITTMLEAAIRWLSKNPIIPTPSQAESLVLDAPFSDTAQSVSWAMGNWQRRMFFALEPEVPKEIKDLQVNDLDMGWEGPINKRILEAYRRGQKSKTK